MPVVETTPYGVEKRGEKFVVVNGWTGREYGTYATREEAEQACIRIKRERG